MQIVITDGYTLNPGDLSWDPFYKIGEVAYYDRSSSAETIERCRNATVIITNKTPITREVIDAAPQLKLIAVSATGYNIIDIVAAKEKNILVCNVPVYGTYSVSQHTFALILELTNQAGLHARSVKAGEWAKAADWSYTKTPIIELSEKVLGIVGFGRIGQQTAQIAAALGMQVRYYSRSKNDLPFEAVTLGKLAEKSDFISLHCPLTANNKNMIDRNFLLSMKPSAFLINTSRGQLINETDLAEALKNGTIAGAALDVLSDEPPSQNHPLVGLPNCIITPHIAWVSFEARKRMMQSTYQNIVHALEGKAENVVNP